MKRLLKNHYGDVLAVFCALVVGLVAVWGVNALADQGLTGNPSSSSIIDIRPAIELVRPAVSSATWGKTWQVYEEVDFSEDECTSISYLTIGTVPAYHMIRAAVIEVVTTEETTATCDLYYATTAAVSNADFESTGTLAQATVYATRANTAISLKPDHDLNAAVVRVWVMGETLIGR